MTITESFSYGVPVLSSDIGNQASIVNMSGGGCTYKLFDKDDFAKKIEEIILNNQKYSEQAKNYYNEKLNEKKNYEELMNIYEQAKRY